MKLRENLIILFSFCTLVYAQQSNSIINLDAGNLSSPFDKFSVDKNFSGGGVFSFAPPHPTDRELLTVRHGSNFTYNLPVPNGKYWVSLNFAEVFNWPENRRRFHVNINGERVLTNLDVSKEAGGWSRRLTKNFIIEVRNLDGLSINFQESLRSAIVSSISVYSLAPNQSEPIIIPEDTTKWCNGPIILRESEKQVSIGSFWSEKNICQINFELSPPGNLDPLHIVKFKTPILVKIKNDTALSDDIHVWVRAPSFGINPLPAVIQVGVLDSSIIEECVGCEVVVQTKNQGLRLFPKNVVPLGFFIVYNGIVHSKTTDIYSTINIQLSAPSNFFRNSEGGYVFVVSENR